MVKGPSGMNHHHDRGSDNDFDDCADWSRASYESHPIDSIEPIDLEPNGYRQAALYHLRLMLAVDEFITAAPDARFAVIVVAVTLGWPSTRGLSIRNIADQIGCTPAALTRSIERFKTLAGLGVSAGGVRPGPGSLNGDKSAAVQA
jgi:hypothetical protein